MAYGYSSYNTAGVPHITSFAQAKHKYEQTKPIKGSANVRPLGVRRYHKMASISMPDADTVNLEYCGKPLVQWRSDNTYTVHRPVYSNAYTPSNTSQYVPKGAFGWRHGDICVRLSADKEYFIPEGGKLEFQVAGTHHLLLNKPVAYAIRANRNAAMKIMTKYQPFMDWLQVVAGVKREVDMDEAQEACDRLRRLSGVPSEEDYEKVITMAQVQNHPFDSEMYKVYEERRNAGHLPFRGASSRHSYTHFHRPSCEMLDSWLTDTNAENWVQAMYVIARHQGRHIHIRNANGIYSITKTILPIDKAVEFLRAMTSFVHRDEVFTRERLPDGQLPTKANLNFFHEIHLRNLGTIDSVSKIPN
jgi:hypothetical protein